MRLEAEKARRCRWRGVRPGRVSGRTVVGCGGIPLLMFDFGRTLLATAAPGMWA